MNINKEFLSNNREAEIVVIDLDKKWKVSKSNFKSKSFNSGFIDQTLTSKIIYTIFGKNCFINK